MNLQKAQEMFIPKINAEMRRLMAPKGPNDLFYGMMHYHLGWVDQNQQPIELTGGKQLRPLLTLLCCQAAGASAEKALTAAATIELVHNFSLIHDDIEDRSDTRRGKPTVWAIWGEPQAINAGDAMLILARHALLDLRNQNIAADIVLEALEWVDQTCLTLCRGQYLDMGFEETMDVDLEAYLEMINGKTAALLACAGFLGGLIATKDATQARVFAKLGTAMGMAFQIQDDWLGIWGDPKVTGKTTADDLRRHKKSLPVVFTLNQQNDSRSTRFKEIYAKETLSEADVNEAITILEEIGAKTYIEEKAQAYVDEAHQAMASIQAEEKDKLALQEMAEFFVKRVY